MKRLSGPSSRLLRRWTQTGLVRAYLSDARLHTREYDDRDGNERTVTEVVASQLLGGSTNGDGDSRQTAAPAHATPSGHLGSRLKVLG